MEPQFTKEFEVQDRNNNQYRTFISDLRQTLTSTFTHGVPALIPTEDVPTRFFDLVLRADNRSVTFRLRMDNLYLIGYRMENGQWLEFNNSAGTHLIREQGTAFLGFDGSYTELERAAHMSSTDEVTVGSQTLRNVIHTLATSANGEARARSLMTVIVMFSEAIRLVEVQDFIARNYVGGARVQDADENLDLMQQIHTWGQFSEAMFLMDAFPREGPVVRQWGIRRIVEMMGIALHYCYGPPHMRPPRMAVTITQPYDNGGSGQCYAGLQLLEVFSVRIFNSNVYVDSRIYGTITVTDALRTQVIYNCSRDNAEFISAGPYDVLLTGPSDAISALGNFTIKFLLYDKARNDVVLIDEEINWNFYDFGNVYDKLISKQLNTGMGSVTINYAVFKNAVAAKLKLQKLQGGEYESEVYGKVSSSTSCGETKTLLFHRESADYVTIRYDDIIPFSRSVVVVPLSCSTFTITAKLFDSNVFSDQELVDTAITFQPKTFGSDVKPIREDYFVALMRVDWVRAF